MMDSARREGISPDLITPRGARLGTMQFFYYRMCEEAFADCARLTVRQGEAPKSQELWTEEDANRDRRILASAINSIVLAGMCLEAAIYDYAAWHLPEHVVESLDKVDFVAKWRIIPFLVTGHEIPAGGAAHNALIALNRTRNRLVHAKSQWFGAGERLIEQFAEAQRNEAAIRKGHIEALKTIILVSLELDRTCSQTVNPLPNFSDAQDHPSGLGLENYPPEVRKVVMLCRRSINAGAAIVR